VNPDIVHGQTGQRLDTGPQPVGKSTGPGRPGSNPSPGPVALRATLDRRQRRRAGSTAKPVHRRQAIGRRDQAGAAAAAGAQPGGTTGIGLPGLAGPVGAAWHGDSPDPGFPITWRGCPWRIRNRSAGCRRPV
jgi:hypothetical protein